MRRPAATLLETTTYSTAGNCTPTLHPVTAYTHISANHPHPHCPPREPNSPLLYINIKPNPPSQIPINTSPLIISNVGKSRPGTPVRLIASSSSIICALAYVPLYPANDHRRAPRVLGNSLRNQALIALSNDYAALDARYQCALAQKICSAVEDGAGLDCDELERDVALSSPRKEERKHDQNEGTFVPAYTGLPSAPGLSCSRWGIIELLGPWSIV